MGGFLRRPVVHAVLVFSLAPETALGDGDEARWNPGREVAGTVEGEVEPGDTKPSSGGVYGRFEGDLDLGLGLGVEAAGGHVAGASRLSLHYFSMAGITAGYTDAIGGEAGVERTVSVGIDLRPTFVPRWALNLEHGPGVVDLTLDSISVGMAAFWSTPRGRSFGDERGFEGSLGLGVPLLGTASGPWLEARGVARWADPGGRGDGGAVGAGLFVLSWHALLESWLVSDENHARGLSTGFSYAR